MREQNLVNQGASTVEAHTQLRNSLSNSESKKDIRNQPLIQSTLIIGVLNATVRNQIHDSDVDQGIILLLMSKTRHFG